MKKYKYNSSLRPSDIREITNPYSEQIQSDYKQIYQIYYNNEDRHPEWKYRYIKVNNNVYRIHKKSGVIHYNNKGCWTQVPENINNSPIKTKLSHS